jgi:hypothetical protein
MRLLLPIGGGDACVPGHACVPGVAERETLG